MTSEPGDRFFAALPAIYRERDRSGDLGRLLAALEQVFLEGRGGERGIEGWLPMIPALFAPGEGFSCHGERLHAPPPFVDWLAAWLSFTPRAHFATQALRRIVAGIVPLYSLRGTRRYLVELLQLCFQDELDEVQVDDRPRTGFTIGESALGSDTRLAVSRPFWFKVVVAPGTAAPPRAQFERRLRAVIDFAKPAHTAYELHWQARQDHADPRATGLPPGQASPPEE